MSASRSLIILCRDGISNALTAIAHEHGYSTKCLNSLLEIENASLVNTVLISMSSGVIVPSRIIDQVHAAYNFHGATPSYPGRDPHYWALFDGASVFGCTAHVMLPAVDSGSIVATRAFKIKTGMSAEYLRQRAEIMNVGLYEMILPNLMEGSIPSSGEEWCGPKRTRADFLANGLVFEKSQKFDFLSLDPYDRATALYYGIHLKSDINLAQNLFSEALDSGHQLAPFRLTQIACNERKP